MWEPAAFISLALTGILPMLSRVRRAGLEACLEYSSAVLLDLEIVS